MADNRNNTDIAALDMLNNAAAVHTAVWDPTEPAATRPLLLQTLSGWYTCGFDQVKNVTELFYSSGNIAASYDSPFGATLSAAGPAAALTPFRFSSEVWDAALGLVCYTFRPYNPLDGRFINRDPVEEGGGLNLYGFVGNDPVNTIDILGLSVSPTVLEEISSVIGSAIFGGRVLDEVAFIYYGGRENFLQVTGRELYSRGNLAGKMWDRAISGKYLKGTMQGDLLRIDEANQSQWGNAIEIIQESSIYRDRVEFIQKRLQEGTSRRGYVNIEFNTPSALASSIHGAQLHYNCQKCKLALTIRDEYNFDRKHMWRRLQQEGYIIPYSVIILMPTEKCGGDK
jgi:RHS repeat-associated protein